MIRLALFAIACFLGAEIGHIAAIPGGTHSLPALWPPTGLLVGALILADRRQRPELVATACGAMLISSVLVHRQPVPSSVGLAAVSGIEATILAWLVQRTAGRAFTLARVPHTWALIVCAIVVANVGGALAAALWPLDGSASFFTSWRGWWLAHSLGIVVTAPLLIGAVANRATWAASITAWKVLEVAVVFTGAVVLAAGIFSDAINPALRAPAYVLPFLLWPSFRFGPGGASAAFLLVSCIGLWNAALGHGPLALAGEPAASLVLRSQGALVSAAVSFLLLASVVSERKRVAIERTALVSELQQALAEIKTLRGLIPICAWCHKVRDDGGYWQGIDSYLDERTEATFSHGICPGCAAAAEHEIASLDTSSRM